jgi:hypothetical protein
LGKDVVHADTFRLERTVSLDVCRDERRSTAA